MLTKSGHIITQAAIFEGNRKGLEGRILDSKLVILRLQRMPESHQ